MLVFVLSMRRRHTICALVTGVQTCALPIYPVRGPPIMVVPLAVLTRVRVAADVFADRNAPSLSSRGARIYRQGGRAAQAIRRGGARRLPRPAFADKSGRMVRPATNARLCPARFDYGRARS